MIEPTVIAIPFFVLLILLELYLSYKMQKDNFGKRDSFGSLSMGLGSVFVGLFLKGLIYFVYSLVYQFRLFDFEMSLPLILLLFLFDDFTYYWFHRISHSSRFFWASHSIHHSSEKYNLTTALRQTWTGDLTGTFLFWIWLPFIGFSPEWVMIMKSLSLIYQFWIHTELIDKLPKWFEFIFNTPSHHRVHHAVQAQYLDRNHAGVLIIWDRLFGTFVKEEEKPIYGLVKNINTYHPVKIALYEWKMIFKDLKSKVGLKDKLKYVFYAPGWSHDKSRKTSQELREEYYKI
jgi:sterol desaturase/sphingolipid hydroxylase (fatty acid hydroxylase superfamily)